ncbi:MULTISPECIES: twin-arginine translocation signal domain-containing protein [Bacillus]|uniref:Twin-arginine translocation signal domain-containing protein n=2 Tax=Bacillus TaxID=1386 RepID=A0A0M4FSP3_9BACI|nr:MULTISPECIES: twin-arginine translocation signal domain-containing protein [Bacillus]ALC82584.1 hypothetical protein AM592_14120 [Bacillus gobiensis]MBP1081511.1 hypothetical protein [Bacillus capparidis]MED1096178.1 twin-arginine translocation signal domain-containing protein [Bacillus capparidis]
MPEKKLSRRKFLGYLGAGIATVAAVNLPIKAFAEITDPQTPPDSDPTELPNDPGTWGDAVSEIEKELPQDPNVLLIDVEEIYKRNM